MRESSKSALFAGCGILVGMLVLAFSVSPYRILLGSMCVAAGLLNGVIAFYWYRRELPNFPQIEGLKK